MDVHSGDDGALGVEYGILITAVAGVIVVPLYLFGGVVANDYKATRDNFLNQSLLWTVHRSFSGIEAPRGEEAGWGAGQGVTAPQPQPKREA
jgi:Flp pilus assembly pilin Flp